MNKNMKKLLAALMALCTLVSVAMPTVFATGNGGQSAEPSADLTVNFESDFSELGFANGWITTVATKVDALESNYGTVNMWNLYKNNSGTIVYSGTYACRPKSFTEGGFQLQLSAANAYCYYPLEFVTPGTGAYQLSLAACGNSNATAAGAYILDVTDVELTSDLLQGDYNQSSAQALAHTAIDVSQVRNNATKVPFTGGTVNLYEGKKYVVVFYGAVGEDTGYIRVPEFSLTYQGPAEPEETTEPEETQPSLTVNFKDDATVAGITATSSFGITATLQQLNAAYEAGTIQWTPYTGANGKLIHQNANDSGTRIRWNSALTKAVFEMRNNEAGPVYVALKFRAPGTGNYQLSVNYAWLSVADLDAQEAGAYILNMPTTAYTATTLAASEASGSAKVSFTPGVQQSWYDSGDDTVYLVSGQEYLIVFYAKDEAQARTNTDFADFALTYVNSDEPQPPEYTEPSTAPSTEPSTEPTTEPVATEPSLTVNFQNDATITEVNATTSFGTTSLLTTLNAAYEANTIQWAPYIGSNGKLICQNAHSSGTRLRWNTTLTKAVLEIRNNEAGPVYVALKFRAPGTGNYQLSLNYTWLSKGDLDAQEAGAYILNMPETAYTAKTLAASEAQGDAKVSFTPGTQGTYDSGDDTVYLVSGQEYLIVFYAKDENQVGTNTDFTEFTLTYMNSDEPQPPEYTEPSTEPSTEATEATEATQPSTEPTTEPVATEPSLTVNFQNDATITEVNATTSFGTTSLLTTLNAAYETGSIQWAPYIGSNGKLICQNAHSSGTRLRWNTTLTKAVFEMRNNEAGPVYVALKFRAPGTGNYQLSLNYTWLSKGDLDAQEAGAYILNMPETAYTSKTLAASEAMGDAKVTFTPGTQGTYDSGDDTVYLVSGQEYIIVFYAKDENQAGTITDFADFALTYMNSDEPQPPEYTEPPTEPAETTEPALDVNFQADATTAGVTADTYFSDATLIPKLNAAYEANSIQWAPYTDENSKLVHNNGYSGGARLRWNATLTKAAFEIRNANIGTVYAALKFRAPGTGNYQLSLNYTWLSKGDLDATEAGAYILNMPETAYTAKTLAASEAKGDAKVTFTPGTQGTYDSGDDTVYLVSGQEYIIVFYARNVNVAATMTDFSGFALTYANSDEPQPPENTEPTVPEGPGYTEGTYNFYQGTLAGDTLENGIESIDAWYEADTLNWKYETLKGLDLAKTSYSGKTNSLVIPSSVNRWIAFRIKTPSVDGAYSIKMDHGAGGNGATAGSIFVIAGDTAPENITGLLAKSGAATTTSWFYGENKSDTIGGRESETGSISLKGNQEYIVVFMPTAKSNLSNNAYFWLGQLQLTRTGDYVETEDPCYDDGSVFYEFYDWDNPGQYLYHYKSEEDLGKKIVKDKIAQEYAEGKRNWCHVTSNGNASFSTGTPYLRAGVSENHYFCLKIKSPGTGTYEITYNYYAYKNASEAPKGSIYILPAEKLTEYASIKEEANFAEAVITASYKADKSETKQSVGTYTAFEEGKEYYLCFSAEDADPSVRSSFNFRPISMTMKRIGDYAPIASGGADDGIVYRLFREEYANKWLSVREGQDYVTDVIAKEYENGKTNWKFESITGGAQFLTKYLSAGVGKAGRGFAVRIKSPGTGTYKVTLKHMLGTDVRAADVGKMYIIEAPEETIAGGSLADYFAVKQPVLTFSNYANGNRFERVSDSGTFGFEEGKEYVVIFYGYDNSDTRNETNTTYMYLDRLVMNRIGDYVAPEKGMNQGGIVAKEVVKEFQHGGVLMTTMNDHDYLVFGSYGGTLLIYDLDEWRLIDEVDVSAVGTPRCIAEDQDGKWWIGGNAQGLYCYDPYTREGFYTGKFMPGGNIFEISVGEDGYLYYGCQQSKGVYIYRYDPRTMTYTSWSPESWATYVGTVKIIGDYIYPAVTGNDRHEIWKMDKNTGKILDRVDISERFNPGMRYVNGMSILNDEYLLVHSDKGITIVDINKMEMLSDEEHGLNGKANRGASGVLDGKQYFVTSLDGLCYYDTETKTFGKVGGELANFKTGLRGPSCIATIEDSRLAEKSIITWAGMTADGLNLKAINLETKSSIELIGLIEPEFGSGKESHTIFNGAPGSGEIIFTAMYPQYPCRIYNTQTKEIAREIMTKGQNDSYCYYQGNMYFGNYTNANLTRMDGNQATALFQLHDENFNQSRIHSICGGDNKVFAGTIPYNFNYGGVIAWYDLETELTYVVTGPNPEDVYYAKCSTVTVTNEWYSAVTHELVDMKKEWDKDQDGDGVCQYFKGPVPYQSIIKVEYANGLLYGFSSLRPGTGAAELTGQGMTSQIFIYDVDNMKMLKTLDLADYIDGLPVEIRVIEGLTADPDIANKLWGVVGETLFSMTHDKDTGKVTIKEELSFNKDNFDAGGSIPQDIVFDGEYMYVLFDTMGGLCRVNRNNPKEYTQLLWDFDKASQVPTHFVLGEDGDIYYVTGNTNLYVLNVDVTEEELAQAKAVQDAIDLIPENITIADREIIFAARAAWDAMDPANQPFVDNFAELEEAEVQLLQLRIDELGEITIEDEAELMSIRQTYIAMDPALRLRVDFQKVSDAESVMSILRGERTTNLIAAIGEVTLEKEQQIRDARASFMALTSYERRLVTNAEVLNVAEAVLTGLILKKNEAGAVDKLIEKIGFVFFGPKKIQDARKAYNKLDAETKDWVENYSTLVVAEIILIAEYLIAAAAVTGGVLYAIPTTRGKIFKKKEKATE